VAFILTLDSPASHFRIELGTKRDVAAICFAFPLRSLLAGPQMVPESGLSKRHDGFFFIFTQCLMNAQQPG
jgi:hypothetical protein